MNIEAVSIEFPEGCNVILGYSHLIKTIEDVPEILITSVPGIKFGMAFSEASGERLVRTEGNDDVLTQIAVENVKKIASGHTFMIVLRDAYPINVLNSIKNCQEVGSIFAATANPISVIVARGENGSGVLGVIDGYSPLGVETEEDKKARRTLLRKFGYKF